MRIRVGHVNLPGVDAELMFKQAAIRRLAWITSTKKPNESLISTAQELGYEMIYDGDNNFWVAVRADLIKDGVFTPNTIDNSIFMVFESTPKGLSQIIVASGFDVEAETIGEALDTPLVFFAGYQGDELGFGFYDADSRVQKLVTTEVRSTEYIEAVITI